MAVLVVLGLSLWPARSPSPSPTALITTTAEPAVSPSPGPRDTVPIRLGAIAADEVGTPVAPEERLVPRTDPLDAQIPAILALADEGNFGSALAQLDEHASAPSMLRRGYKTGSSPPART